MKILSDDGRSWKAWSLRPSGQELDVTGTVRSLLDAVRNGGDRTLLDLTERFDGIRPDRIELPVPPLSQADSSLDRTLRQAIRTAFDNIRAFHREQPAPPQDVQTTPGVLCWKRSLPIEKVGLYVPGGTAPLFSTVLMLGIPAMLAGCREVVLCTPPAKDGSIHPAVLYAAALCGIRRVFRVGGAQAIAAMAYGTETVPAVHKIFGPGNRYVTTAKQLVAAEGVAIDMPAGPSEVVVVADVANDAALVAADLLAQAEHGPDSQVLLLTDDHRLAERVREQVQQQLKELPRAVIAAQALESSRAIVFRDLETAMEFSNSYAPEHLIIAAERYRELAELVVNAGSVFLGPWTPESLGDYASGTNHTLPTNGAARAYSGVSTGSFRKTITFQVATPAGLKELGPVVETMAAAEQLQGHRISVTMRLNRLDGAG